ncbi:alpha/beta fold hydrolase [Azospirillum sp. sgz302134]
MRPVVFDGCFGWLHPAAGRRGVVLCGPYGNEALTMHRAWRGFARRLAEGGLPTLRFDYPGAGDSAGDEDEPARLRAWIDGIHAAVAYLRAATGVEEVALVGLRLGALLAAKAAAESEGGVSRLALLAPYPSGRAFVQELRAVAMLAVQPEGAPPAVTPERVDSSGFRLTQEAMESLRGLDLLTLAEAPARSVLLVDRPDARGTVRLAERLRGLGAEVTEEPFPDFAHLMSSVQRASDPCATLDRVAGWLGAAEPVAAAPEPEAVPPRLELPGAVERPLRFGPTGGLFGILCEPPSPDAGRERPAVLLLNSGATHHVGSGRMSVLLARHLAERGVASLRFDLGGLGDSVSTPGRKDGLIYCRDSVDDARAALDALEAQGHRTAVVIGLCAGAAVALHTALADTRVVGQSLVNPGRFFLGDGDTAEAVINQAMKPTAAYLPRLAEPETWRAILRNDGKAARVLRGLSERAARRLRIRAERLRATLTGGGDDPEDVVHWFQRLSDRGVCTLLVHSEGDVTLGELETHAGPDGAALRAMPNMRMERIAGADHSLMLRSARERFARLLDQHLDAIEAGGDARPIPARGHAAVARTPDVVERITFGDHVPE